MQVVDAEVEGRCAVGPQIIRDQSLRNDGVFPLEACALVSTRRACRAWTGPAHPEPRPRRRRRALDRPCAHRFSDRPRQDARPRAAWDGASATTLQ
jgi:hypothetical protein